jgi:hypothetical protein
MPRGARIPGGVTNVIATMQSRPILLENQTKTDLTSQLTRSELPVRWSWVAVRRKTSEPWSLASFAARTTNASSTSIDNLDYGRLLVFSEAVDADVAAQRIEDLDLGPTGRDLGLTPTPAALNRICARLGPGPVQNFFWRWFHRLPSALTAADLRAGYTYERLEARRMSRNMRNSRHCVCRSRPRMALRQRRGLRREPAHSGQKPSLSCSSQLGSTCSPEHRGGHTGTAILPSRWPHGISPPTRDSVMTWSLAQISTWATAPTATHPRHRREFGSPQSRGFS